MLDSGSYYFAVGDSAHDALNNVLAAQGKTVDDGMDYNGSAALVYTWEQPLQGSCSTSPTAAMRSPTASTAPTWSTTARTWRT